MRPEARGTRCEVNDTLYRERTWEVEIWCMKERSQGVAGDAGLVKGSAGDHLK